MSCSKFEDYLSEKLDLVELEEHMESCQSCHTAYQADTRIMEQSKKLNDNLVIPDLWSSIERDIQKKKPVILKFRTRSKLILTAAATILIITTIWMFNSKQSNEDIDKILTEQAFEKVIEMEEKYLEAIQNLEELAYQQLDKSTEQLAQLYRNKLSLIDRQILNCQDALESNPANSHIRRYLMAALRDKQKTLEDVLRVDS
jgi:predicted anti-sigma-YlaC factor YlaD